VFTNSVNRPETDLSITGQVEQFAQVIPNFLNLRGEPGEAVSQEVVITPAPKYPFSITGAKPEHPEKLKVKLIKNHPAAGAWTLRVTNLEKNPGTYSTAVLLNTNNKARPEMKVRVVGRFIEHQTPVPFPPPAGAQPPVRPAPVQPAPPKAPASRQNT
jgi:hypothetical protein